MTNQVQIDKERVRQAAITYLNLVAERLEEYREVLITRAMQEPGWLGKLFGAKPRTRDEAIAYLQEKPEFGPSQWNEPARYGQAHKDCANALILMADIASTKYLLLDEHTVALLKDFW